MHAVLLPPSLPSCRWLVANQLQSALSADQYLKVTPKDNGSKVTVEIAVAPCCNPGKRRLQQTFCIPNCTAGKAKAQALATLLAKSTAANTENYGVKVGTTKGAGGESRAECWRYRRRTRRGAAAAAAG